MAEEIPALVAALAAQAKGNPISWKIDKYVTIVFEDGRKLTFEKEPEKGETPKPEERRSKKK